MPSGKFEFKLAVRGGDGEVVAWQPGENRSIQVPADPAVLHVQVCWDGTPAVEVEQPASQGAAEPAVRAPAGEAAPGEKVCGIQPCAAPNSSLIAQHSRRTQAE